MLIKSTNSSGFSLTEMMVALLIGSLLVGSSITILSSTSRHNHQTVSAIRLNQDLQGILEIISNDLRRAGYWSLAANDIESDSNNNPYMTTATDLKINNNCVLFSYDANNDGTLANLNSSNDERYGYRLRNNSVQARPSSGEFNCNSTSNDWESITDPASIVITQLNFTLSNVAVPTTNGSGTINIRNVDIAISGYHADTPQLTKTLTHHVRLRNDKFVP